MGKSTKSSSSSSLDPVQQQMLTDLYGRATAEVDKPYQAYTGQTLAGFTPAQLLAQGVATAGALGNVGGGTLNQAVAGTQAAMGYQPLQVQTQFNPLMVGGSYQPQQVQSQFNAAQVQGPSGLAAPTAEAAAAYSPQATQAAAAYTPQTAQAAAGYDPMMVGTQSSMSNIGGYMNPYLQNVAGNVLSNLDRTRQMTMQQNAAAADAAGAFGGSRHGVVDAETNRNFFDVAGQQLSSLYNQGFDTAASLANTDLARALQAQQLNQSAGLQAGLQNQQLGTQANFLNANNALQAGLQNQQLGTNVNLQNAANALQAGLQNQQLGTNVNLQNASNALQAGLQTQQLGMQGQLANQDALMQALGMNQAGQLANQQAGLQAGQMDLQRMLANQDAYGAMQQLGLQGQLANQSAGYSAANLGLSAANQLASLSDQQRQQFFGNAAMLEGVGNAQQAMQQAQLDDAYARWLEQQNEGMRDVAFLANVVNGMPSFGGTSVSSSSPSAASQFGQALGTIGALKSFSDKNMKSGRKPVRDEEVLDAIEKTPVERWRYDPAKGGPDDGGVEHIGPMAQSVAKNLGIGDGRMIPVVDMMGTQMAATKALAKKVKRLEKKGKK